MLRIESLTKLYPGTEKGVRDLTLHVRAGELCAFIGPNGAGKTTTLRTIAGIHSPDAGRIVIDGIDLAADPIAAKGTLAYIPDEPELYGYLTGAQYLSFVADIYGVPDAERKARLDALVGGFGLGEALGTLISTYSHGMRQKLAITSALLHRPRLLILDEPFVGLDPQAAATVKTLMRELCAAGGAVFFSTHVLEVAERLCDTVAILRDGRLVTAGAMEAVVRPGSTLEDIFMEVAGDA